MEDNSFVIRTRCRLSITDPTSVAADAPFRPEPVLAPLAVVETQGEDDA